MSLKLYYDSLSQPAKVLYIFMKTCKIPFESKIVNLANGEHLQPQYEKIHPFKKIPALEHNGFNIIESNAILRYLCNEFKVEDHWYPKDSKLQARVNEYLEWQHLNSRLYFLKYFRTKFLIPMAQGKPPNSEEVSELEGSLNECLNQHENIWLKNKPFLAGNEISIADIVGACEIEQPTIADFNPRNGRPVLSAWLDRVSKETSPHFEEANAPFAKYVEKYNERFRKL